MDVDTQERTGEIERVIREIIARGSEYDFEALNDLYADDLEIVRVGLDGSVRTTDKASTLRFFRTMREAGSPPLSRTARVRVLSAGEHLAHVVVLREMQVEGMPRRLVFSLDLRRDAGRWRVAREVAVAQS